MTTYQKQSKVGLTSCGVDTMLGAIATPKIHAKFSQMEVLKSSS